ncbi:MarR family winged helix-turn-helix transcriptional regulator [Agromyces sp. Marseille-Q5079]|uniref:MarR family winged helix-turn-helix transcriptional regulator n=1 Tax=Agromyces sp. Marseille-Q5079 TaxID=3439059 RepID=UPI003D9CADB6
MDVTDAEIANFWFLVRKSAALMDRGGEELFREGIGISLSQFMVLSVIDARPGAFNQQTVADYLGLTKGTVSRQIENAEAAGLLTTSVSPVSRREKVARLTAEGTETVRRGDELLAQSQFAAFSGLDADDLRATIRTLSRFAEGLHGTAVTTYDGATAGPALEDPTTGAR